MLKTPCMSVALVRCWRGLSASSEDQDRCQCLQVFNTIFLANPNNNVLVLKKQCINISMLSAASMPCLWALGVLKSRFSSSFLRFFKIWFFQRIPIKMGVLNLVHELLHSFGQLSKLKLKKNKYVLHQLFNFFWWAIHQLIRFAFPFFLWFQNNPWKTFSDVILRVDSWWRAQHDPEPEVKLIKEQKKL